MPLGRGAQGAPRGSVGGSGNISELQDFLRFHTSHHDFDVVFIAIDFERSDLFGSDPFWRGWLEPVCIGCGSVDITGGAE